MAWTQRKKSGRWTGYYRDHTGKARSAGTYDNKDRALTAAANKEAVARNQPDRAQDLTWTEWKPVWLATLKAEASTLAAYEYRIRCHIEPRWGDVPLTEITTDDIQAWVDGMKGAPSSIHGRFTVLSASLAHAARKQYIPTNPCADVSTPRKRPSPERFLTDTEVAAIRDHMTDPEHLFAYDMLLATGMRWGELAGLHWDHIDFERKRVRVEMQWVERENTFRPTKGKNVRTIPLPDKTVEAMKARVKVNGWGKPCEATYDRVSAQYGPVLADVPPKIRHFREHLQDAAKNATAIVGGIERPIGKVRVHDLRHTMASKLAQTGVTIQTVSAILGHASLAQSQHYAQVSESEWDHVRTSLSTLQK